jgi:leader peptidase (prepilin peptidase) / N-methyltransferase
MRETVAFAVLAGVLGLVAGSFLNVVVYRLPRRESLVAPRSRCPACAAPIKPYDNVPLLSWLLLRGRCRACAAPISPRYPLVELATAALCVGVVLARHSASEIVLGLLLVVTIVPCALIDLEHHLIPNRITAPAAALAVALGSALDLSGEPQRLIAGAGAGGALLLAALAYPKGMGMGDVKLAGVIGLMLGRAVVPAIFAALLAGVLIGILVLAAAPPGERRKVGVPFGPFLALGAVVGLFAGDALVSDYLHHLH